ncbi:hypothetical protein A2U01_0029430, partial [Trifolium medium]|nr:hypothetical protein [Trifolium medium]
YVMSPGLRTMTRQAYRSPRNSSPQEVMAPPALLDSHAHEAPPA